MKDNLVLNFCILLDLTVDYKLHHYLHSSSDETLQLCERFLHGPPAQLKSFRKDQQLCQIFQLQLQELTED
eukprot:Gb_34517 [translate_table: standard]